MWRWLLLCAMLSRSVLSDSAAPWTVVHPALLSMEFSRGEYWNGLPCPPPGDFPTPGIKPRSPALQADSSPAETPGKPHLFIHRPRFSWSQVLFSLCLYHASGFGSLLERLSHIQVLNTVRNSALFSSSNCWIYIFTSEFLDLFKIFLVCSIRLSYNHYLYSEESSV